MTDSFPIAILGRSNFTHNYESFLQRNHFTPLQTLNPGEALSCRGLLLPGGGDITPAFFGQLNRGSQNIDTELDILQLTTLELFMRSRKPVLGICKGMQLINIALGGTLTQHLPNASAHLIPEGDIYHGTRILPNSVLSELYGTTAIVNSAHHQCIDRAGKGLHPIQFAQSDNCPEAIVHEELPILGVQWHPERLDAGYTSLQGDLILSFYRREYVRQSD